MTPWPPPPAAVLFDRDGTLVRDVPYNGRPELVEPMPGATAAVDRLRAAGVRLGVVSNQSGVGRGLITAEQTKAVNERVEDLLGPFGSWAICPHDAADGCACRKPAPLLVRQAAAELGVDPADCVVIGDIGTGRRAAYAAGARAVLVPTPADPAGGDGRAYRSRPTCSRPGGAGWLLAAKLDQSAAAVPAGAIPGAPRGVPYLPLRRPDRLPPTGPPSHRYFL